MSGDRGGRRCQCRPCPPCRSTRSYTPRIVDNHGNDLKDLNLHTTPPAVTVQVPITQQTQYKEVGVRVATQG